MTRALRIGLVGDRDDSVVAHRAIPRALSLAAQAGGHELDISWLATEAVDIAALQTFDGLWCVPASPYASMDGALHAIGHAREREVPFLGTCGGFQHAVIEYARSVLGWANADHAETAPDSARPVVVPLACALVEVHDAVHLLAGSRMARAYGTPTIEEDYHCRYGLGEDFREAIKEGALHITAVDDHGDVRGVELQGHPFFVASLFQPERVSLAGRCPPLVSSFVDAVAQRAGVIPAR